MSVRDSFLFSYYRIRKLYTLHLVMSLAALPLLFRRYASMADAVRQIQLRIVLNICLIQAWFPWQSLRYSMNNLSWFLSCMTFLYFMFPYLLRAGEKIVAKQRGPAAVLAVICGMMLYGILADMVCGSFSMEAGLLRGMTYNFPVFRLGDFFTGCLAGLLFKERKKDRTDVSDRVAVSVIFATLFLLIWPLIPWNGILESGDGVYLWWLHTVIVLLPAVWIVCVFVEVGNRAHGYPQTASAVPGQNIVWKAVRHCCILCRRGFIFLGNISGQGYLIHELIIIYLGILVGRLYPAGVSGQGLYIRAVAAFLLMLFCISAIRYWNRIRRNSF